MSLVSIIIPVYNEEKYLPRCIESVLRQSYDKFEVLLINDGSKDASGKICDEYAIRDTRIRVYHKPNEGVSKTRNLGISMAQGDWVMFLDSDDYLLEDALFTLLSQAQATKTLITCANLYIEKKGCRDFHCTGFKSGVVHNNFRAWYFQSVCLCAGATMYHRSIITDKMYDEDLCRGEDVKCIFNLLRSTKLSYTNKCVMVYSLEDKGLSGKCVDRYKDHVFHMDFAGKSFWEKMEMGATLNGAFDLYFEHEDELRSKYKDYMIYSWLDCKIRRFKNYKRRLYNLLFA